MIVSSSVRQKANVERIYLPGSYLEYRETEVAGQLKLLFLAGYHIQP
jgi:hypothetical protein